MTLPGGVLDELRARLLRAEAAARESNYAFRIDAEIPDDVAFLRETLGRAERLCGVQSGPVEEWNAVQLALLRIRACGWGDPT